jgi:hypothetical protein
MASKKATAKKPSKGARGGYRPGAGRPSLGKPRSIVLDDETFAKAERIGDGNASEGVRIAVNGYSGK